MKRIFTILLFAIVIFSACTNDGSSTVGVYENDEPAQVKEHNVNHEGKMSDESHQTKGAKEAADSTHAAMPAKGVEMKDSTMH